jgi:phosphatidate cytidylyltransferase
MILIIVKSTDIGAYFGGRALGRHKLIPWLSPGKTWEGLICGVLVSGAIGAAMGTGMPNHDMAMAPWKGFIFGVAIGAIGQVGDLLESLMKRDAQVKDSGRLIPGFGGILDVIDSPLFAAPFAYLLFSFFARIHA